MKKILLGLLSLLLISCADLKTSNDIDPELQAYVSSFQSDANSLGRHIEIKGLTVKFGSISNPVQAAECQMNDKGSTIIVSRIHFDNYTKLNKFSDIELLMYHELGHCVLGILDHDDTRSGPNNFPSSIMNTYIFSGLIYKTYKQNYIKELFLGVSNVFN